MTKEEAIANIKRGKCIPYKHETLTTIIEALKTQPCDTLKLDGMLEDAYEHGYIQAKHDFEAQPCKDAVSRKDACHLYCQLTCGKDYCTEPCSDLKIYLDLPSVQPKRPKGRWIRLCEKGEEREYDNFQCSVCNYRTIDRYMDTNFCPNCGADMRGENK